MCCLIDGCVVASLKAMPCLLRPAIERKRKKVVEGKETLSGGATGTVDVLLVILRQFSMLVFFVRKGSFGVDFQLPGGLTSDDIYPLKLEDVAEMISLERKKLQKVGELTAATALAETREQSRFELEKTAGLIAAAVGEMKRQKRDEQFNICNSTCRCVVIQVLHLCHFELDEGVVLLVRRNGCRKSEHT